MSPRDRIHDLAVFYEHPSWFAPLFGALERAGVDFAAIAIQDHVFDPACGRAPAQVILSRLAMSSFLRQGEHGLYYALAALDHWQGLGARVVNGPAALAYDLSKARQLSLFARAGLHVPPTRVAHRAGDLATLAAEVGWPVLIKANVGGSGAGIAQYENKSALTAAVRDGATPVSVDGVLLVQAVIPARDGRVIRCETLGGRFLYAIALEGSGGGFDLCPADVCLAGRPQIAVSRFEAPPAIVAAVKDLARRAHLDLGGVEYMVDDRDGLPRFYDLNALSNFVSRPREVLGFDPHDDLVEFLEREIGARTRADA